MRLRTCQAQTTAILPLSTDSLMAPWSISSDAKSFPSLPGIPSLPFLPYKTKNGIKNLITSSQKFGTSKNNLQTIIYVAQFITCHITHKPTLLK